MRKALSIAAVLIGLGALTACDVIPGGACKTEGQTNTNDNGYVYKCQKHPDTGNLFWGQEGVLTPERP